MDTFLRKFSHALTSLPEVGRYLLAFSGGLDSHVLLHALVQIRQQLPPVSLHPEGIKVCSTPAIIALHVHHGLHADADSWTRHCQQICAELQVELRVLTVNAAADRGVSPEDAARIARYEALHAQMQEGDGLLTAHHQEDQAETLLLQLLRGSGPHGLAAMPRYASAGPALHMRPMLGMTRDEIREYAQLHQLQWIEDSSNEDTGYDRNYIRHEILPALRQRWPAVAATLSRSATHCADAAGLIDERAREDLAGLRGAEADQLSISSLLQLQEVRCRNLLRAWLEGLGLPLPSTAHMQHILQDVLHARADATPVVRWPGAEVRRYRDILYAMPPLTVHAAGQLLEWDVTRSLQLPGLDLALRLEVLERGGLDPGLLSGRRVMVRFRTGGERCQPAGRQGTHDLRKLFQELGIPPWRRQRIPLIYVDDVLAAVAGLLVCEQFRASDGQHGVWPLLEPLAD